MGIYMSSALGITQSLRNICIIQIPNIYVSIYFTFPSGNRTGLGKLLLYLVGFSLLLFPV